MKVIAGMRCSICGPRFACPRPPGLANRNHYKCEIWRSDFPVYEASFLLECDAVYFGKREPICQRNLLRPSSQWKFEGCKRDDKYRRKDFKRRPFLTFLLSHIRSVIVSSQLSLRLFLHYISSFLFFSLCFIFFHEDGENMFLWKCGTDLLNYTASLPNIE
jgi:hypothetical protein